MPKLLFFSRVALICNGCFLFTFVLHYLPFIPKEDVPATVLIMGVVMSIGINLVVNMQYLYHVVVKRTLTSFVPSWIVAINFLVFIFQVILLVK